jgi:osmotically-inducible protein OsmY
MTRSTAPLIPLARNRPGEATGAALLLQQRQEDLGLAERIERALRATGYGSLRGLEVTVRAGYVTLGGRVPSYYLKQVAQTAALTVPGTCNVRNDLDVARPG